MQFGDDVPNNLPHFSDDHESPGDLLARLELPPGSQAPTLARGLAAAVATVAGFGVDALDDLRLCVSEAVSLTCQSTAPTVVSFTAAPSWIGVEVTTETSIAIDATELAWLIISNLAVNVHLFQQPQHRTQIRFRIMAVSTDS